MTTKAYRMRKMAAAGMADATILQVVDATADELKSALDTKRPGIPGRRPKKGSERCPCCDGTIRSQAQRARLRAKGMETVRG